MSHPRSTPAVWISLLLIIAAIATFALGAKALQGSPTRHGLGMESYIALLGGLLGSVYFIARLGYAGAMIIFGIPPSQKVAWTSPFGAHLQGGFVLALVIAAMVLTNEKLVAVAISNVLAHAALIVIGRYANLREAQGWDVEEVPASAPILATPRQQPRPRPAPVIVTVAPPIVVAPPIATAAPRSAERSAGDEPSLLR